MGKWIVKSILEEFKAFAVRGNAIDMAVGIIIGAAFTQIVLRANFVQWMICVHHAPNVIAKYRHAQIDAHHIFQAIFHPVQRLQRLIQPLLWMVARVSTLGCQDHFVPTMQLKYNRAVACCYHAMEISSVRLFRLGVRSMILAPAELGTTVFLI